MLLPLKRKPLRLILAAIIGLLLAFFFDVRPSHAQFLGQAEGYFSSTLGESSSIVVGLIFFALRSVFIYYVGAGLVETIRHARTGESDWAETARKPVVAIVIVVVGDAISLLVIGG